MFFAASVVPARRCQMLANDVNPLIPSQNVLIHLNPIIDPDVIPWQY